MRVLLPHEEYLVSKGALTDVSHAKSSAVHLSTPSLCLDEGPIKVALPTALPLGDRDKDTRGGYKGYQPELYLTVSAETHALLYRPVGDLELLHLLEHGTLPDTQPYQAVIEGEAGRLYAEKFVLGSKKVNTHPRTVVEFCVPRSLVDTLFAMQHKCEDGVLSMGLGDKAGKGLPLFNEALSTGQATYRIVRVKRPRKPKGKGKGR
ncbi:hypothetical protein KIPB_006672 [Kipferlia bialata]|uniref:Uncharacterized protein n=1 Tax=Kipferlia bialata TaxID=797122 RepID=A0A9K3CZZ7_9EUKA|nr:hypothetical protein KIPB_006672 [Kipferlia bialata]|eukprot:g6672.t1